LAEGLQRDRRRDAWLARQGIGVLRFSSREVLVELPCVLQRILAALQASP
jgi:very-short-patch-repair endonuclease